MITIHRTPRHFQSEPATDDVVAYGEWLDGVSNLRTRGPDESPAFDEPFYDALCFDGESDDAEDN